MTTGGSASSRPGSSLVVASRGLGAAAERRTWHGWSAAAAAAAVGCSGAAAPVEEA